jgi:hypothetical protein
MGAALHQTSGGEERGEFGEIQISVRPFGT